MEPVSQGEFKQLRSTLTDYFARIERNSEITNEFMMKYNSTLAAHEADMSELKRKASTAAENIDKLNDHKSKTSAYFGIVAFFIAAIAGGGGYSLTLADHKTAPQSLSSDSGQLDQVASK